MLFVLFFLPNVPSDLANLPCLPSSPPGWGVHFSCRDQFAAWCHWSSRMSTAGRSGSMHTSYRARWHRAALRPRRCLQLQRLSAPCKHACSL